MAELYDKGKGNGLIEDSRDVFYDTGVAMFSIMFEAAPQGLSLHGHPINAAAPARASKCVSGNGGGRPTG